MLEMKYRFRGALLFSERRAEVTLEQSLRRMNNEMRFTMIQGNENVRFVAPIGSHVG